MKFTCHPIEHTNESTAANSTEGYNTDNLPMGHQV